MNINSAMTPGNRSMMSAAPLLVLFLLLSMPAALSMAATIHVPADQGTIQAGIDAAADGDTVMVANGLYSGDGNRDLDFHGKAITVQAAGGANLCIIDCDGITSGTNHRGFIFQNGEGGKSVLQGFTIRNGDTTASSGYGGGGAILCSNGSPRIAWNILTGNRAGGGGAIFCGDGASPTIAGNIITGNWASDGGGICCGDGSTPHIALNTISGNTAGRSFYGWGGGIFCGRESVPTIVGNTITDNRTRSYFEFPGRGGGVCCFSELLGEFSQNEFRGNDSKLGGGIYMGGNFTDSGPSTLTNNIFVNNTAGSGGGVAFEDGGFHTVNSCSFFGNSAGEGGGIYYNASFHGPAPVDNRLVIVNSILWQNESGYGPEVYVATQYGSLPATIEMSYTDVMGGIASCYLQENATLVWGAGMITDDPYFAGGPNGDHYLSQFAAGQTLQSPCVDSGEFAGASIDGTTRTDGQYDSGVADMGYHYRDPVHEPDTVITSGPDWDANSPAIAFTFSGRNDHGLADGLHYSWKVDAGSWSAFSVSQTAVLSDLDPGAHTFSVRARDLQGHIDGTAAIRTFFLEEWEPDEEWVNIVTGPGPGPHNPPLVRTPEAQWLAYGAPHRGVNVACGNIDGGDACEVITGPGPGPEFGPHIRCWSMSGTPIAGGSFMAYGTPRHGANVAAGDIDGDGFAEIITGAGPGAVFGPHVRGWNHDGSGTVTPAPGVSFMAYGTLRYGVNVACGDIDGDGIAEIITGAGPGPVFGAHVRGWNHDGSGTTLPIPGVSFFAYGTPRYGVNVACGDVDGDGFDEILTAPGPGPEFASHVRGWNYDSGPLMPMGNVSFFAYNSVAYGYGYGAKVSAGDVDLDGVDEILVLPGPDPEATTYLRSYNVEEDSVDDISGHSFYVYDDWMTHGGNVAGVKVH